MDLTGDESRNCRGDEVGGVPAGQNYASRGTRGRPAGNGGGDGNQDPDAQGAPAARNGQVVQARVRCLRGREEADREDVLIAEYPLTIYLNGEELVTLLCTPDHLQELAVGFLYSEGFLQGYEDIVRLRLEQEEGLLYVDTRARPVLAERMFGKRTISSGCGRGTVFYQATDALGLVPLKSSLRVPREEIGRHVREMQERAFLYRSTGGAHCAALATRDRFLFMREDIGRHNAVDKVTGECLSRGLPAHDKVLLTTGRLSSEIVVKTVRARIPVLVSRSAPTGLAVAYAEKAGLTLVGFARGPRLNVYAHPERVC